MRLYTILNSRQPGILGGVQASHAIGEMSFHYHDNDWVRDFYIHNKGGPFIFLKGPNTHNAMAELAERLLNILEPLEIPVHAFFEPDLNNTLTAITLIVPTIEELDLPPIVRLYEILETFHTAR